MPKPALLALIGAGRSGQQLAQALVQHAGMSLVAVADPIPARRSQVIAQHAGAREFANFEDLFAVGVYDAAVVALPNDLLAQAAVAALKKGAHVLLESPCGRHLKELKQIAKLQSSNAKVVMPAMARRCGAFEMSAKSAIAKDLIGQVRHVRLSHTRTRGVPAGTGWYENASRSGGGALLDLGLPLLDLAVQLLGQVSPSSAFAQRIIVESQPAGVEHAASAMIQFGDQLQVDLSVAWQLNQPPQQQGLIARFHGTQGCLDLYTRDGAVIWRGFDGKSPPKLSKLQQPKLHGLPLMAKQFKDAMLGKTSVPPVSEDLGKVHSIIEACYASMGSGKAQSCR
jgi:predicted dehydrogenase